MLELRLAGIHDDGENLVLESADGTSYLLPIDQNLRTSIAKARRIQPARGRAGSAVFGPRDIQTRFRQGASVEDIVAESGWDAERVRKYEWPIIAERGHIITAARSAHISEVSSRGRSSYQSLNLNQRLVRVLAAYHLEEAEQLWSTYQQESGQWTINLDMVLTPEQRSALPTDLLLPARWSYNPANQSIYASNDAAYFFMGMGQQEEAVLAAAPVEEEAPKQVDFARHAGDLSMFPSHLTKVKAVRVPHDEAQEELLDELESRRGTRDFGSAAERKLADLLERARRTKAAEARDAAAAAAQQQQAPAQVSQAPAVEAPVAEAPREVAQETTEEAAADAAEETQAPASESPQTPELDAEQETSTAEEAQQAEDYSHLPTRSERRRAMLRQAQENEEAEEAPETPEAPVAKHLHAEETEAPANEPSTMQEEIEAKLQQVRAEREAARAQWEAEQASAETEAGVEVDEAEPAPAAEEADEQEAEEAKKPATRSAKSRRASVPSWDDIIFGNQRK